jgi:hypothetical protein
MAQMLPSDATTFHTDGEASCYRFLAQVAKPDDRYTVWYVPEVDGVEPDFILFSPDLGLLVLEVKDWYLEQIDAADPERFHVREGRQVEARRNPLRQAREYTHHVLDRLRDDGRLMWHDGPHANHAKVPIGAGVVLPNINKYEYTQHGLDQVIHTDSIFFWDDLHPQSDLCADRSGGRFRAELERRFPPRFACRLSGAEIDHLRQLLFPAVRLPLPRRQGQRPDVVQQERLRLLDHHQEALAYRWGPGHHILTGPPGSGKTLVLVYRAVLFMRYEPRVRPILFVCYNIMLVDYIKRLLIAQGVPLGPGQVEVMHLFELCAQVIGDRVEYERRDPGYYDLAVELALAQLPTVGPRYEAVLIDEAQDFSDDMLRLAVGCLQPASGRLALALDDRQTVYARTRSWQAVGINARGRTQTLSRVYRNSAPIAALALACRDAGPDPVATTGGASQLDLFAGAGASDGPLPLLHACASQEELVAWVADQVRDRVAPRGDYPASELAILYASRGAEGQPGLVLPERLQAALEVRSVMSRWATQDYHAKRSYDITADRVTLSTIHSAKGLDWACVILVGLDRLEADERWTEAQVRSLAYVGMTRARHELLIPYQHRAPVIERALAALATGAASPPPPAAGMAPS